eukprot:CAMPEP_0117739448 /NCGR_PEP_ID=MMETSP0947-20121206/3752_1 /TAXON_ID=44440 /ORGANISM="Chattonella subsalsa, Strain CCMP2191" /LENGTH=116 /DNA_ID=CAMNT_0005555373 /DNA_START=165 /DNA_END=515 /DNA_ORIENTATION=-
MTSEPGNLMNLNRAKFSGCNNKAIDLKLDDDDNVIMGVKSTKKTNLPPKAVVPVSLKKHFRKSVGTIKKNVIDNYYRADLESAALARYTKLYQFSRVKKGIVKAPKMKKGRNSSSA